MSNATVNIPSDVLEPIVMAQVSAGIVAALGQPEQLIAKVVERALALKVDSDGTRSDYSNYNTHNLIEVLAGKAIREVTEQAIRQWVQERKPEIEAQVRKGLARSESRFAKALVDGLVENAKSKWDFKCDVIIASDR